MDIIETCAHLSLAVYSETVPDNVGVIGYERISDRKTETFGMAYITADNLYLVFRGSQNKKHWLSNFKILKKNHFGIRAHKGFSEASESVMDQVRSLIAEFPNQTPVLSGHSLGGAIAVLVAVALRPAPIKVITFGQPRVSTTAELRLALYGEYLRVVNGSDVVPRKPMLGYSHAGSLLYLSNRQKKLMDPGSVFRFFDRLPTLFQRVSDHDMVDCMMEYERCV